MFDGGTNTVDVTRDPRRRPPSQSITETVQEINISSDHSILPLNDLTPRGEDGVELPADAVVAHITDQTSAVPSEPVQLAGHLDETNGTLTLQSVTKTEASEPVQLAGQLDEKNGSLPPQLLTKTEAKEPTSPIFLPMDPTPWGGEEVDVTAPIDQPTAVTSESMPSAIASEDNKDALLLDSQLQPALPNGSHHHEGITNGNSEEIKSVIPQAPRVPFQELKAPLAAGLTPGLSALVHRKSPNSESTVSDRNTPLLVDDGTAEALRSPGYKPSIAAHKLLPSYELSAENHQITDFKPPVANMIRSSEDAQLDVAELALADLDSMDIVEPDLFMDASEHLDLSAPTDQVTEPTSNGPLGPTDLSTTSHHKPAGILKTSKSHSTESDRHKRLYSPSQSNYRPDFKSREGKMGRHGNKGVQHRTIQERYARTAPDPHEHRTTAGLRPAGTRMDMSERLLNDQSMEVEYIKGQGPVLVRHNQATTTETPLPKRIDIPDEIFPLINYKSRSRKITMRQLKWIEELDGFEIGLEGDEKVVIHAEAVKTVYYDFESRKYYLFPNGTAPVDKRIDEIILEIGGTEKTPYRLRSILEKRFGGVNVAKRPKEWFYDKEIDFDRPKKIPMKPTRTQPPPRESSADDSSSSERDDHVAGPPKTAQGVYNYSTRTSTNTLKRKKNDFSPFNSRKKSREYSPEPKRRVPQRDRPASKKKRDIANVSPTDSTSDRAGSPVALEPLELHYVSGELVRLNDLVLRIREDVDLDDNRKKFDALDVYDGPFRISEIPPAYIRINDPERDEFVAMQEKKVRLSFPEGSKGKPLTKLARLRPIYMIQADTPEGMDARGCYYWPKSKGREKIVVNDLGSGTDSDDDDEDEEIYQNAGVACLQKGFYVRVHYISSQGAVEEENETLFEVEKLRDKKIERLPREEFPDENMDDPIIVDYLQNGGILDESEILVVKYLVHWAGWPSEDDTYERAQDNIPDVFIQAYESRNGPDAVIPKPRASRMEKGENGEKSKRGRKKGSRKTI